MRTVELNSLQLNDVRLNGIGEYQRVNHAGAPPVVPDVPDIPDIPEEPDVPSDPDVDENGYIKFADPEVLRVLLDNGVGDGIGITTEVAEKVTDIGIWFKDNTVINTFDELQKFSGITNTGFDSYAYVGDKKGGVFSGCSNLTSVILPPNVTELTTGVFLKCSLLKTVGGLEHIQVLSGPVFNSCLEFDAEIDLPNLKSISGAVFTKSGITKVKSLGVATSLVGNGDWYSDIRPGMFGLCDNLTEVNLPETLTNIGNATFAFCSSLTQINLQNVTTIDKSAFHSCSSLSGELSLPNLTSLGGYAFYGTKITAFIAPLVTTLPAYCFSRASQLVVVDVSAVTSVEGNVFDSCASLATLIVRSSTPPTLGANALRGTAIAAKMGYIYVPDESVEAYKTTTNWSNYADIIFPISEQGAVPEYENITGNYNLEAGQAYGQVGGTIQFTDDAAYEHTKALIGDVSCVIVKAPSQASSLVQYVDANNKILKIAVTTAPSSLTRYNIENVEGATHIYITSATGTLQIWKKVES